MRYSITFNTDSPETAIAAAAHLGGYPDGTVTATAAPAPEQRRTVSSRRKGRGANSQRRWSEEDTITFLNMWDDEKSPAAIGRELGRTKDAIKTRMVEWLNGRHKDPRPGKDGPEAAKL